ncbi:MAG: hypothetical protein LBC33_02235 [Mycoplasmataceae bacterium]|jgi:hypothetical protein|nr:hypothetical protein [Mycoplasmataceae bacterium]
MAIHRNHHSLVTEHTENTAHVLHTHSIHNILFWAIVLTLTGLMLVAVAQSDEFLKGFNWNILIDAGVKDGILVCGILFSSLGLTLLFVLIILVIIKALLHSIHHHKEWHAVRKSKIHGSVSITN